MKKFLNRWFWLTCRLLLSFRYRTKVHGLEQLRSLEGPTLVIPNHPAYVDPPLVSSHIRLHKPLRPLVFSGTYRMAVLRPLMALVDAFEVPDMSSQSQDAQAKALQMIDSVVDRLQAGDCMLIYPSGRLQRGNVEVVGAARSVYEIVKRCPDLNLVMIRTRGVWGSMYSCAESGTTPNLAKAVTRSAGWVFASLFFFLPRRDVSMQVEIADRDALPLESKEAFNTYLESWYNIDGPQEPKFVPYHHWFGPREGSYGNKNNRSVWDGSGIKAKTIRQVNELVQSHTSRELNEDDLKPDTMLEAIGLDSLERMDLALEIERQFGFHSDQVAETLGELWALADGRAQVSDQPMQAPEAWDKGHANPQRPEILAPTIAEAFVRRCLKTPGNVAVADALSGVLTYRKMLIATRLMAKQFAAYEEQHVGIMLPASVAADVAFFALHMAGKVPVMMNWTTGPSNLAHGVEVTGLRRIITSKKMIDRMRIKVEGANYVYLEDIRASIKKSEAVLALLESYLYPAGVLSRLPRQERKDNAVFLFTSGSESLPKTVPLSHENLLVNVEDGMEVLQPDGDDSLLGFLPPFHSFGMTGNVLLPFLAGIKCVRYADPTDSSGLVRTIAAYRPSMIFTTPTFLGYILATAKDGELKSLKKIITGAEKCPQAVFDACRKQAPEAVILEGYGITECSPVVSANLLSKTKFGSVGKPVSHIQIRIVDVDNGNPVGKHETGMLLVSGPSIFSGYYRHDGPSPFVELDGKRWYQTGDLVAEDEDGFLHFRGRLKRFLKAGGEMISLPALEEPFQRLYPADENGSKIAVEGIETDDGRHVVLFTTEDIGLRQASEVLVQAGLRGVMRLDEVRRVEAIPVLGTGKTDYKVLRNLVQQAVASSQ